MTPERIQELRTTSERSIGFHPETQAGRLLNETLDEVELLQGQYIAGARAALMYVNRHPMSPNVAVHDALSLDAAALKEKLDGNH